MISSERLGKLPDLKNAEAVQKYFLEEIQLGKKLLAQGDFERGMDHLTNAIAVCTSNSAAASRSPAQWSPTSP